MKRKPTYSGFTLAELLIALAILGVIATFTIPKVLNSSTNSEWNAKTKEVVGLVSEAYQAYKLENSVPATFSIDTLTPYINYVQLKTAATDTYDNSPDIGGTLDCSPPYQCMALHTGALLVPEGNEFDATTGDRCTIFLVDPDGVVSGNADSIYFVLHLNGRISTIEELNPNCNDEFGAVTPSPGSTPSWFSWNN